MTDLSVLIPARCEQFLARTIEDILTNMRGDTEVIAVLDGAWADPPIPDHPRVTLVYHPVPVGQRAATNEAARMSNAKFIMKCDAHCAFDEGFDVKMMSDCEYDWTAIPRMYNLHVFDWKCKVCGNRMYQCGYPTACRKVNRKNVPDPNHKCPNTTDFEMVMVWKPRRNRRTDNAYFDDTLHYQPNWRIYDKRPEAQGEISDVMCCVGACWMMHRERYWELGGMDEAHGSWGQMGVELACKAWLSGGRQVVNKKTWFAHLFRTQPGFGFPYEMRGEDQEKAREYSRKLWLENRWPKAVRPLSWIVDKFAPVPGWHKENEPLSKGIVYYTCNTHKEDIEMACREQLERASGEIPVVAVSLGKPIEFGDICIVIDGARSPESMHRQVLAGLENSESDIVFLCESDVLYHPSHFDFIPPRDDVFYYNEHTYKVDYDTGQAVFYYTKQVSGCCAYRKLLLAHYQKRIARIEQEGKFDRRIGYEPGCHQFPRGIDEHVAERWMAQAPNVDIRHDHNLTVTRWRQEDFRDRRHCQGWNEVDAIPGWGVTKGRFNQFIKELK